MKPFVKAFLLCQEVYEDDLGRLHVEGVFDRILAVGFPIVKKFQVFLVIANLEARAYTMTVEVTLPDQEEPVVMALDLPPGQPPYDQNQAVPATLPIRASGCIRFDIRIESQHCGTFRIPVHQRELL